MRDLPRNGTADRTGPSRSGSKPAGIAVVPGNTLRDGAKGFPRNGVTPGAEFTHGNFRVTLASDEHDRIPHVDGRGNISDVHNCLIHRDPAEHRTAPALNQDVGAIAAGACDAIAV